MTEIPDFPQLTRRDVRQRRWIALLAPSVAVLAITVGLLVLYVADVARSAKQTAEDTNRAVHLLDERTPLFAELQATESRIECVVVLDAALSEGIAEGLTAVVAGDDETLASVASRVSELRRELLRLGTEQDPCPR